MCLNINTYQDSSRIILSDLISFLNVLDSKFIISWNIGYAYIIQIEMPIAVKGCSHLQKKKKKLLGYLCSRSHLDRMTRFFFLKSSIPKPPIKVGAIVFIQLTSWLASPLPAPFGSLFRGTLESHLQAEGFFLKKNHDHRWK